MWAQALSIWKCSHKACRKTGKGPKPLSFIADLQTACLLEAIRCTQGNVASLQIVQRRCVTIACGAIKRRQSVAQVGHRCGQRQILESAVTHEQILEVCGANASLLRQRRCKHLIV